ncbi:rRNA accumulation-related protein [Pyricularia oryzae]|uniref:Pre-rRNA-processing protein TSR2 n=1 Tax=Pyricularia oryzae TaxID=318829 RepID=A0A4P7NH38_PYROR|nr:hypothetical protein PoMZ_08225 [Pyricularia oryzae]
MASSSSQSPDECQNAFERGVALSLHLWEDMTFAVQNNMGGGDSADKRDWTAGAVAELFPSIPEVVKFNNVLASSSAPPAKSPFPTPDDLVSDVEERLLDIMMEEFETAVQDDTAYDVAEQIVQLWTQCCKGSVAEVNKLAERWQAKKGKTVVFKKVDDADQDTDWDDTDGEEDDEDDEDEAPALVEKREKPPPEVDEDGFTKVTRKK